MQPTGFADEVRGRQPHAIDRELSTLLQDNYVVSDVRRGMADDARELPANWARMGKDDVRAAGLDPALMHDAKSGFDASFYRNAQGERSEEHTSELQSLMRISYAVFCLKKNKNQLNSLTINTE